MNIKCLRCVELQKENQKLNNALHPAQWGMFDKYEKLQKENTELREQLSCCKEQNLRLLNKDNVKELYALEKKYAQLLDKIKRQRE